MKHFLLRTVLTVVFITNVFEVVAESVTVNLTREGTLAEKVLEQASSLSTVTELTITGKINENDWKCITLQMSNLDNLNMSSCTTSFSRLSTLNSNLEKFVMPEGITNFAVQTFYCNLLDLTFSNSVETIEDDAFSGNYTIQIIRFGKGLKRIESGVFGADRLAEVHIPDIEIWCNIVFEDLSSIPTYRNSSNTKVYLNGKIVDKLDIPSNIEYVPSYAFYGWKVSQITIPKSVVSIGKYAFANNDMLTDLAFPTSLNTISERAFYMCTSLKNVSMPQQLSSIGKECFYGCESLHSITLPPNITTIGIAAFYGCTSLAEISFPESVTSIGSNAFSNCTGLTKVVCLIPFPISLSNGIFTGINQDVCTLVVPEWSALLYKMAIGWSEFAKIETVSTGDLALLTVNDNRYLPESVRPNGTPNVYVSEEGSLTVRGNKEFNMNELTLNIEIGESKWNWGYDENGDYIEYCTPNLIGSSLLNDESKLTAKRAKLGLKSKGATWGFITLPFDANLSDITPMVEGDVNNYIWKTYDGERRALLGSGGNWKEATGTLKAGVGYIYQSQNDDSVFVKAIASTLSNMLSNGDITLPLKTYAANDAEDENWNFIGNPYPTYFNTRYIDFTAPITVWNGNGYDAVSLTDDDYTLAPCQAFFVQKQEDTESIKFFAEGRTTEYSQSNNNNNNTRAKLYNATTSERNIINLYLEGANYKDKSRIVFNEKAKLDYELNCDATKFMNEDANIPQLYSIDNEGCQYAINERPEGSGFVTLGIVVPETGQYTISVDKTNLAKEIYLIDTKENIVTELASADYTFYSDATTSNSRFILSLDKDATGINNMNVDSLCVNITNKGIIISNALGDRVEVYTLDGKCVYDAVVSNQHETIAMNKGTYVVKVAEKSFKTVIK